MFFWCKKCCFLPRKKGANSGEDLFFFFQKMQFFAPETVTVHKTMKIFFRRTHFFAQKLGCNKNDEELF